MKKQVLKMSNFFCRYNKKIRNRVYPKMHPFIKNFRHFKRLLSSINILRLSVLQLNSGVSSAISEKLKTNSVTEVQNYYRKFHSYLLFYIIRLNICCI